ncbi:MAG: methyltransferase domain-containing protein [Nitrosomonadales bacterium]|nr:methyltransferase domain-containing protein [Nitrosomonadales bacterium]
MKPVETLHDWFDTPQGAYLLTREQDFFDLAVKDIFGFNAVQLGLSQRAFLRDSRMPLRCYAGQEEGAQVRVEMDELPFETGSLDLVLMPHVLEFSAHPHQILREVERVLMPEGQIIISGFNPRSLWGLHRWGAKDGYPWCGEFIALSRLKDWLALLGFEVVAGRFACYAPPFRHSKWIERFSFVEPSGDRWWAVCGGVYFLQAVKRVPGMRLIKPNWNNGLVSKLIPVAPKLNRDVTKRADADE